jgi:branched-chain amino acid transport system permease protein
MSKSELVFHLLNGAAFGMLLFIAGVGMMFSYGLMRVINWAHGGFYLLGAYATISLMGLGLNYFVALVCTAILAGVAGAMTLKMLIAPLLGDRLRQLLLTIGLSLVMTDLFLWRYGPRPLGGPVPAVLSGTLDFGIVRYPAYRFAILCSGVTLAIVLALVLEATRLGRTLRAAVDDPQMARALGVKVPLLLTAVFALSTALAGLAGGFGGGFTQAGPGVDALIGTWAFIMVIVAGVGSLWGMFVVSLYVGLGDEFGKALFPQFALFTIYAPIMVLLALRPSGLFGRSER